MKKQKLLKNILYVFIIAGILLINGQGVFAQFDESADDLVTPDSYLGYDSKCYTDELKKNTCENTTTTTLNECKKGVETTYNDQKQQCDNQKTELFNAQCDQFEPGTTERTNCENNSTVNATYEACISNTELNKTNGIKQCEEKAKTTKETCLSDAKKAAIEKCKFKCGNNKKEPGEYCDDGNTIGGDGCGPTCQKDSDCGNGKVEPGEECDDGEGKLDEDTDRWVDKVNNKIHDGCFRCEKQDVFRVSEYLKIPEGQTYLNPNATGSGVSLREGIIYFIITAIELLTKIISTFALFFIIVGGIIMMVSSGNSNLQQKGKRIIMYAALGLAIAFLSLIIVTFVQSLFFTT